MKSNDLPASISISTANITKSSSSADDDDADDDDQKVETIKDDLRGMPFGILNIENPSHRTVENYDKSSSYDSPIECTDWTSSESQNHGKSNGDLEPHETEVVIISSNNSNTNSTQSSASIFRTVSSSVASEETNPSGRLAEVPTIEKSKKLIDAYQAQFPLVGGDEEANEQQTGTTLVRVYSRDKDTTSWRWVSASERCNQNVPEESVVNRTYSFHDGSWAWEGQGVHLSINTADYEVDIPPVDSPIVEGLPSVELELEMKGGSKKSFGGSRKAFNLLLVLGTLYTALVAGLVIHRCGLQPPQEHPTSLVEILRTDTVQVDAELFGNDSLNIEYSRSNDTESIVALVQPPEDISSEFVTKELIASSSSEGKLLKKTFTARALNGLKNIVSVITGSVGRCLLAIRKVLRL